MVHFGTELASLLLLAVTLIFVLLVLVFAIEILVAWPQRPAPKHTEPQWQGRVAVLIPAHNEVAVVAPTITSLMRQIRPGDRVVVVADNCTDSTATLCATLGAEVVERQDLTRRGKGFALAHGIEHLAADPPDVVVVLDADCVIEADGLYRLAAASRASHCPVQSNYELILPESARIELRIGAFAWRVKNYLRPLALHRSNLPCQLMGSGMAFPWQIVREADLATDHLVEDMMLGLDLAHRGYPAQFMPSVKTMSPFPESREGQVVQRTRWETGHLQVIARCLPRRLVAAIAGADPRLLALVIDAAVPPIAFLVLSGGIVASAGLAASMVGLGSGYFLLALAGLFGLTLAVLLAWLRIGRDIVSPQELLCLPLYALSKVSVYARALTGSRLGWVRSRRS